MFLNESSFVGIFAINGRKKNVKINIISKWNLGAMNMIYFVIS